MKQIKARSIDFESVCVCWGAHLKFLDKPKEKANRI